MKLSIITINYNNAEGLKKTLASVASQTYRDIEHIIVDGCSTDGSVDVIEEYEEKPTPNPSLKGREIKWVSETDKGIYNAMNHGIEIALGRRVVNKNHTSNITHNTSQESLCDYIWILNSGDCVASADVVKQMMTEVERINNITNERVPILMGNIVHTYANALSPRPMDVSMLTFYTGTVPHDAAFVRSDLFEKYGLFDDSMKICADWKLYLDMIALGGIQPLYVDIDVVNFDMSGISNTNNELRLTERRMYLEQVLPASVLKDYDAYARSIRQYERLKKHHLWGFVTFIERVLFKLEKWRVLR